MRLTKSIIDGAKYEGRQYGDGLFQRHVLWDSLTPGLGVRLLPSGKKSFVLRYETAGRKRLMTLGDYGELTLPQARAKAAEHTSGIRLQDTDPLEDRRRRKARAQATVANLIDEYVERHAKVHKKSWHHDETRLNAHIRPAWGHRPVEQITFNDVAKLHGKIGKAAPYEGNRVLEIVRKMFNLGTQWGYLDAGAPNPARGHQRFKEHKRERWITAGELPELAKAIDAEENPYVKSALWLYLLTGVRKNELLRAEWAHIDFESRTLVVPETKSGEAYRVPLSEQAITILQSLPRMAGNPYVFPSLVRGGQHLVNIDKPWRRVRKAANVEDVRLHDLRRTVGAMLANAGSTLLLISKALNHKTTVPTQVYARLSEDPVRAAMEGHGKRLMALAGKQPAGEIIDFEKERQAR